MLNYKTYIGVGSVQVFDKFGQLFYSYYPKTDKPFYFNLNLDKFSYTGFVKQSKKKLIYLTGFDKKMAKMPSKILIQFTNNGEKASINKKTGVLSIDAIYKTQPFFILCFLYGHEMAHFIYQNNGFRSPMVESDCDIFSAKLMLKRGYNPSQVLGALKFGLGNGSEQDYRWQKMIEFLNSIKTKLI